MDDQIDSLASLASLLAAVARTPRVPPLVPGSTVSDRYFVVGVLGAGGMGVVYRARDLQLQRDVALKLCSHVAEDEARRFLGEAIAMARLQHPNVITVYEIGRFGDELFLVMELVDGPTLRSWLGGGRRPWREVIRMYLDAAAGLEAVHGAGLVHGDFKPDNVLIGPDGRARIADFGLARVGDTAGGGVGGTPRYLAPELRAGAFPSQRSDQYSFCVALAESLRGGPGPVVGIVARGLADDPRRRHESIAALRRALLARLERRRRLALLATAIAVPVFLILAGGWVAGRAEANRTREAALRAAELAFRFEQGRRALEQGNAGAALVYLAAALEGGRDRPAVRFLIARGLAALEQSFVALPATAKVSAVAFLPVGPRALVGDAAGRVQIFELDGKPVWSFDAGPLIGLASDAAGRRVVTAGADGVARVWDVETGVRTAELACHEGPVLGAEFQGDDRIMTRGQDGTIRVWDVAGRPLRRFGGGAPVTVALAGPGVVYSGSADGAVRIIDEKTGSTRRIFGGQSRIAAADLDATGATLATGSDDGIARLFSTRTTAVVAELRHPERVGALQFLPGERLLTGCDDGIVRLWDLADGALVASFEGHGGPITALRLTPDGGRVVTSAEDATVRVWDLATGRPIATLTGHKQSVRALAVTLVNDGAFVLSGDDDGTARIWSIVPGAFVGSLTPASSRFRGAWFIDHGGVAAIEDDGALAVFDPRAGGWQREPGRWRLPVGEPGAAAIRADGTRYAVAAAGGVELWDLDGRERVARLRAAGPVTGLLFSPDGTQVVVFGERIQIFEAETGKPMAEIRPPAPVVAAAATPRGDRVAFVSDDGALAIWDVAWGRLTALPRPTGPIRQLAFDRSGTWLALGGSDAGVHVWDAFTGRAQRTLGRHGAEVRALRFSPDGAFIFSLGSDRKVRVWDFVTGDELTVVSVDAFGGLDVSPDGVRLLVRQSRGRASIWDVARDLRTSEQLAQAVRCLVPLRLDDADRLVPAAPICP